MIEQFHFLRPGWLLLVIPLLGFLWGLRRRSADSAGWRQVVDSRLLPYLLGDTQRRVERWPQFLLVAIGLPAILALAGPTWEKLPQPVYQSQAGLVILLDLSRSMDAADTRPSRLARARHKIADILHRRKQGQTALVVYAADAFTVTPLTEDIETIRALLPSLDTNLMPAQGSRAARALERGIELFANGGVASGDLLLISDGFDDADLARIETLLGEYPRHRLSVLAVGTPEGGPIPLSRGGFLQDRDGEVVVATLRENSLRRVAQIGGGVYASISADDLDINTFGYLFESRLADRATQVDDRSAELWRELGPWLLLVALPLAACVFRRGLVYCVPIMLCLAPYDAEALEADGLWRNPDQQARDMLHADRPAAAAERFTRPDWRGAAEYRAGDYAAALESWQGLQGETAQYNRATTLARLERYAEALETYDALLESNPEHADARFNRDRIAEWLEREQQRQQQQQEQQEQETREQSRQGAQQGQGSGEAPEQPPPQASGDPGEREPVPPPETETEPPEAPPQVEAEAPVGEVANLDRQRSDQSSEQWLRKIPDDPGGLLRRKFLYQYRQRGTRETEAQPW